MRTRLLLFATACLVASGYFGVSAFNAGAVDRTVAVEVVGDSAAYLSVASYAPGPHDCFVSEVGGEVTITFSSTGPSCDSDGGGTGINEGQGDYYFHEILQITNKGTKRALVWVNISSSPSGLMKVAKEANAGAMTTGDYYTSSSACIGLDVGFGLVVGVFVDSGTVTAGSEVTGTLVVDARADASAACDGGDGGIPL